MNLSASNYGLSSHRDDDAKRREMNRRSLNGSFDEVFLVNLHHERGKRLGALVQLEGLGIQPKLWTASFGYASPLREEYEAYQKRPLGQLHHSEFNQIELERGSLFVDSPGVLGYIRTYESIIRFAKKQGHQRILILEDDVLPHESFHDEFTKFMSAIDSDWKVIQFGASQYNWESAGSLDEAREKGFYRPAIFDTCGSFAMGLDHSIFDELLENLKDLDSPFDQIPLGLLYRNHPEKCFVAFPNFVIADVSRSNIRNTRNQSQHSEVMKWELENYWFPRRKASITVAFSDPSHVGINFGTSGLERDLNVKWLSCESGTARPLHTKQNGSDTLAAASECPETFEDLEAAVAKIARDLPDEYLLILEPLRDFSERTIGQAIEDLLVRRQVPCDGIRVFRKVDDIYVELRLDETTDGQSMELRAQTEHEASSGSSEFRSTSRTLGEKPSGNDTADPLVSIIIPTYRRPDNLANAIESLRQQTYENVEIIVVDDNNEGTDFRLETSRLMEQYADDSRVVYLKHDRNRGGGAARNTGIFHAQGEYVSFLDDDDAYLPHKTEVSLKKLMELDESYGAVYGGFIGWNSNEEDPARYVDGDLTKYILTLDYTQHYLHTCTALYRKRALLDINGFDESFKRHQDLELNLRFFERYKMGTVPQVIVQIRPTRPTETNYLDGPGLYAVKQKYLEKFTDLIERFPVEDRQEIYRANWAEVVRCFDGRDKLLAFCREHSGDSFLREIVSILAFDVGRFRSGLEADFTPEMIADVLSHIDLGAVPASVIRDLPYTLCDLLDVRHALLQGNRSDVSKLCSMNKKLQHGAVAYALKSLAQPQELETDLAEYSARDRSLVAATRELLAGPTVPQSVRCIEDIDFRLSPELGATHAIPFGSRFEEFVHLTKANFKVGKHDCVKLWKHGLLVHPNSDSSIVWVEIDNPLTARGVLRGLILQHADETAAPIEVFLGPNSKTLKKHLLCTVPPGSQEYVAAIPVRLESQLKHRFVLGTRMPKGKRAHRTRLVVSSMLVGLNTSDPRSNRH